MNIATPVAESIRARLAAHPVQTARIAGADRAWRAAGAGTPLVLLHGIGSGSGSWLPQLEALSDRFRVIAWDAPGYGRSDRLPEQWPTAADYAAALAALLDALAPGRVLLVGQSLGAMMATAFAAARPERLHGLVLISPAGGYGRADPAERERRLAARLAAMDESGPAGLAERRSANLLSSEAGPEALELVRFNMALLHPDGHAQAARLLALGCLEADAARYAGPALVACGSADRVTPEQDCRRIAGAFVRGDYLTLPGAGHASNVEHPEPVNRMLVEFARTCGAL